MVIAARPTQIPVVGASESPSFRPGVPRFWSPSVGGGCKVVAIRRSVWGGRARLYEGLLVLSERLNLLRRILHDVIAARTLNAILIRIVIYHRSLSAKVIPRRR